MRRWPAVGVSVAVLIVAVPALTLSHHAPGKPLPGHVAIADALRSRQLTGVLAGTRWTSARASAIDSGSERVGLYDGSRLLVDVLLDKQGRVTNVSVYARGEVPYGDWVAYEPSVMVVLAAVFVLMVGVVPLGRLRNLDVVATLSLIAPVVLVQHGYNGASAISAAPGLLYLMARCLWRGLGPGHAVQPVVPLCDYLTRRWTAAQRSHVLGAVLVALALVYVMVGVSSPLADDVAYAVMEGATKILHGILPYGHLPGDVVHGDTYPILSYALYVPLAWATPVKSIWDSVDAELALTVVAALATAAMLACWTGRRHTDGEGKRTQLRGLRTAVALLAFPPLLITVSTGTTDVTLGALLMLAVLLWQRPAASAGALAAAGWFKLAPFALVPIWLAAPPRRRLRAASAAIIIVSTASLLLVVALGGLQGISAMVHAVAYQFNRASPQSMWSALGVPQLQPIGEAVLLALLAGASVRLRRAPHLASDPARIAATGSAILLGLQLDSSQWVFTYVAWVMPLMTLSLLTDTVLDSAAAAERAQPAAPSVMAPVLTPTS